MTKITTHPTVRAKALADKCPKCNGELDTGWECNACGFDAMPFIHISPKPDACNHDFQGWIDLKDEEGRVTGGTTVCTKCGMDAISYSLRVSE